MSVDILNEKRVFERFSCKLDGKFETSEREGKFPLRCVDLSAQGLGVMFPLDTKPQDKVSIFLNTKTGSPLSLDGKVCWIRREALGYRAGVWLKQPLFYPLKFLVG